VASSAEEAENIFLHKLNSGGTLLKIWQMHRL
jgi:hypothetical protein